MKEAAVEDLQSVENKEARSFCGGGVIVESSGYLSSETNEAVGGGRGVVLERRLRRLGRVGIERHANKEGAPATRLVYNLTVIKELPCEKAKGV